MNPNYTALLTCTDGNERVVHYEEIGFTDLPLPRVRLYCVNCTIVLPSEY